MPLVSQFTGRDLEVAEGVNLDSDTELEAALQPQIRPRTGTGASRGSRGQAWVGGRSRPSSVSSAKLKYQSEIRNLIASHQNLDCGDTDSDTDDGAFSAHSNSGRYEEEEPSYSDQSRHRDSYHGDQYGDHSEVRLEHGRQGRINTKSVIFGSNSINKRIHEEFRQKAKRNESFKIALASPKVHRRGSMADSLRRSMEDVHDGFVSLSGRTSRSGSVRSRSGSVSSLRSVERSQTVEVQDSSESEPQTVRPMHSMYRSQERLGGGQRPEKVSLASAGLDVLSKGLGPRRSSRERNNKRGRARNRSRSSSRHGSRDNLGNYIKQMMRTKIWHLTFHFSDDSGSRRQQSRSREQLSASRDSMGQNNRGSFGKDFVNFYMGKMK